MVYKENLVCVIKHDGDILREKDGLISLPFNSEYSILLKNLDSRKASVKISIDGEDVLDNKSLVIAPNSETELEGFLNGCIAKNKFKFIQKTKEIKDFRGDRIDDGIIRVEFAFEKRVSEEIINTRRNWNWIYPVYYPPCNPYCREPVITYSSGNTNCADFNGQLDNVQSYNCSSLNQQSIDCNSGQISEANNIDQDEGITVKGSEINQNFNYASVGELDSSQVIVLRLCGEKINGTKIKKPITTKTKLVCSTCGRKSKSSSKFCSNCGTFLE